MTRQEARDEIQKHVRGDIMNISVDSVDTVTFELITLKGQCYYGHMESGQTPELEFAGMIDDFE